MTRLFAKAPSPPLEHVHEGVDACVSFHPEQVYSDDNAETWHHLQSKRSWTRLSKNQVYELARGQFVPIYDRNEMMGSDVSTLHEVGSTQNLTSTLPVATHELYYQLHGTGAIKVLFISGLNVSHTSWIDQMRFFSHPERRDRYQICVFNNRGCAFSSAPNHLRFKTSDMACDTWQLLKHLGWLEGVHVVGISMGGMIALELMTTIWPITTKWSSLTLTSTTAGRSIAPWRGTRAVLYSLFFLKRENRPHHVSQLLMTPEFLNAAPVRPDAVGKFKSNYEHFIATYAQRIDCVPLQAPANNIAQTLSTLSHYVAPSRLALLRDSKVPVLVVVGTVDHLISPHHSTYLAKILEARKFIIYKNAGHYLPYEKYDEYNTELLAHIESAIN